MAKILGVASACPEVAYRFRMSYFNAPRVGWFPHEKTRSGGAGAGNQKVLRTKNIFQVYTPAAAFTLFALVPGRAWY